MFRSPVRTKFGPWNFFEIFFVYSSFLRDLTTPFQLQRLSKMEWYTDLWMPSRKVHEHSRSWPIFIRNWGWVISRIFLIIVYSRSEAGPQDHHKMKLECYAFFRSVVSSQWTIQQGLTTYKLFLRFENDYSEYYKPWTVLQNSLVEGKGKGVPGHAIHVE